MVDVILESKHSLAASDQYTISKSDFDQIVEVCGQNPKIDYQRMRYSFCNKILFSLNLEEINELFKNEKEVPIRIEIKLPQNYVYNFTKYDIDFKREYFFQGINIKSKFFQKILEFFDFKIEIKTTAIIKYYFDRINFLKRWIALGKPSSISITTKDRKACSETSAN